MATNKDRRRAAKKRFKKEAGLLLPIDIDKTNYNPRGITRAFHNNRYTVMVYDNERLSGGFLTTKLMVQKLDDTVIVNHWSELQKIKNELFGPEATAIEFYPAESELINDHNIYWLWLLPNNYIII